MPSFFPKLASEKEEEDEKKTRFPLPPPPPLMVSTRGGPKLTFVFLRSSFWWGKASVVSRPGFFGAVGVGIENTCRSWRGFYTFSPSAAVEDIKSPFFCCIFERNKKTEEKKKMSKNDTYLPGVLVSFFLDTMALTCTISNCLLFLSSSSEQTQRDKFLSYPWLFFGAAPLPSPRSLWRSWGKFTKLGPKQRTTRRKQESKCTTATAKGCMWELRKGGKSHFQMKHFAASQKYASKKLEWKCM